ncbi:HAD family hydrolase [Lactobacillus johnsonii]|uniref:Cof-type HAD-IIB family hydrolase n=1 Tax=Lactobacillus johnsonii TaxID=33959 RepID=UPI0028E24628|nr:HAD family hydrolase [Lactobacillus johnsonii]MDT9605055.1 HAD family hydrolase [Lactobacillus johnsonii]
MIKQIFSDMDGTILNNVGEINPKTAKFLRNYPIPLTLVSARAPMEMESTINELNLTGPQIAFNSGLIFEKTSHGIKRILSNPIPHDLAIKIITFIREKFPEATISWYTTEKWNIFKVNKDINFQVELTKRQYHLQNKVDKEDIYKIMVLDVDEKITRPLAASLKEKFPNLVNTKTTGPKYCEITSCKAVKSAGIKYIQQKYHLQKNELIAFGDGENDIEMFQEVGVSVAMGNAVDEVKRIATIVTDSNQEDGIINALAKLDRPNNFKS